MCIIPLPLDRATTEKLGMLAVIASAVCFAKRKSSLDQMCAALTRIGQNVRWAQRHHAYVPIRVIRVIRG
jgi:hypothetical protein